MTKTSDTTLARAAYTFEEFAQIFGHDRAWVYRQVKAGKIRAITGFGKMMVPASEVERITNGAESSDTGGEGGGK